MFEKEGKKINNLSQDESRSCSGEETENSEQKPQHPLQRMADHLLEEYLKKNQDAAILYANDLIHYCLKHDYFAMAKTAQKLYHCFVTGQEESHTRKYLMRIFWILAKVQRERNYLYLVHGNKNISKTPKNEHKSQDEVQLLYEKSPSPVSGREKGQSKMTRLLSTEVSVSHFESDVAAHPVLQPPHIKFHFPSEKEERPHQHAKISKPSLRTAKPTAKTSDGLPSENSFEQNG
ncbi:MAG: hypothetical protein LBQ54_00665 [Planctomycetaceae bacterium]|jgi:hypothetical protein|nr:hypothetical protein [Planctomycetaceae bacterium]